MITFILSKTHMFLNKLDTEETYLYIIKASMTNPQLTDVGSKTYRG